MLSQFFENTGLWWRYFPFPAYLRSDSDAYKTQILFLDSVVKDIFRESPKFTRNYRTAGGFLWKYKSMYSKTFVRDKHQFVYAAFWLRHCS